MKQLQAITALLLLSAVGLSGCDQMKDLATEAPNNPPQMNTARRSRNPNGNHR